jgi:hypothetical protein
VPDVPTPRREPRAHLRPVVGRVCYRPLSFFDSSLCNIVALECKYACVEAPQATYASESRRYLS